jgi:hypothetical protein
MVLHQLFLHHPLNLQQMSQRDNNFHQNVLAVLYYASGYFAACTMLYAPELWVKAVGAMILLYISYMLIEQFG